MITGSVPECLNVAARDFGADLIVVGSTSRGPVGRVLPGSVGDRLLAGAACAVAVAPRGYAAKDSPVGRIGVGVTGEDESHHALVLADQLAGRFGAVLSLIAVVPWPPYEPGRISHTEPGYHQVLTQWLEDQLHEAARSCVSGEVQTRFDEGDAAEALIQESWQSTSSSSVPAATGRRAESSWAASLRRSSGVRPAR